MDGITVCLLEENTDKQAFIWHPFASIYFSFLGY